MDAPIGSSFSANASALVKRSALFVLGVAVLLVAAVPDPARSQDVTGDSPQYSTGAIPMSEAEIAALPPTPLTRAFLPELVDLSSRFPKPGNQGRLGSCTAWAVGYAARSYYESVRNGYVVGKNGIPSPAYIYSALVPGCTGGTGIAHVMALLKTGSPSISEMPYSDRRCETVTDEYKREISRSGKLKIEGYRGIAAGSGNDFLSLSFAPPDDLPDLFKAELARGNPVVTSVQTDPAFHELRGRNVWERKTPADKDGDGWHAITLVGYNERGQYFKFINSWGTRWGDQGYGRLSYQTIVDHRQAGFVMSVSGAEPSPPDPSPEPGPKPPPEPVPQPKRKPEPLIALPVASCGKIDVTGEGADRIVTGFVGTVADREKVNDAANANGIPAAIEVRPWPQCETLMTLEDPLEESDTPQIDLPKSDYVAGDTLSFSVTMAGFEGFLHVAYIQADGTVVNLVQQSTTNLHTQARNSHHLFGDGFEGRARFVVSPPLGDEMIVAIASASPLFDEPRPTTELEREFLTALRKAILARPDPDLPERRVTASYQLIKTKE